MHEPIPRRRTRMMSSPMNLRVTKKATQISPIVTVMKSKKRNIAEATQAERLTFL